MVVYNECFMGLWGWVGVSGFAGRVEQITRLGMGLEEGFEALAQPVVPATGAIQMPPASGRTQTQGLGEENLLAVRIAKWNRIMHFITVSAFGGEKGSPILGKSV